MWATNCFKNPSMQALCTLCKSKQGIVLVKDLILRIDFPASLALNRQYCWHLISAVYIQPEQPHQRNDRIELEQQSTSPLNGEFWGRCQKKSPPPTSVDKKVDYLFSFPKQNVNPLDGKSKTKGQQAKDPPTWVDTRGTSQTKILGIFCPHHPWGENHGDSQWMGR